MQASACATYGMDVAADSSFRHLRSDDMALRMTRRDTYGGERGWQDGAGVSWTNPEGGGRSQWRDRAPVDTAETAEGQRDTHRTGIFNDLAVKLGFRKGRKN